MNIDNVRRNQSRFDFLTTPSDAARLQKEKKMKKQQQKKVGGSGFQKLLLANLL